MTLNVVTNDFENDDKKILDTKRQHPIIDTSGIKLSEHQIAQPPLLAYQFNA